MSEEEVNLVPQEEETETSDAPIDIEVDVDEEPQEEPQLIETEENTDPLTFDEMTPDQRLLKAAEVAARNYEFWENEANMHNTRSLRRKANWCKMYNLQVMSTFRGSKIKPWMVEDWVPIITPDDILVIGTKNEMHTPQFQGYPGETIPKKKINN